MKKLVLISMLLAATNASAKAPETNDPVELKRIIATQEKQIQELQEKLAEIEPAAGKEEAKPDNKLIKNKFMYHKE